MKICLLTNINNKTNKAKNTILFCLKLKKLKDWFQRSLLNHQASTSNFVCMLYIYTYILISIVRVWTRINKENNQYLRIRQKALTFIYFLDLYIAVRQYKTSGHPCMLREHSSIPVPYYWGNSYFTFIILFGLGLIIYSLRLYIGLGLQSWFLAHNPKHSE